MKQQPLGFICLIAFVAAIAGFLFGFDTGIISGALKYIAATYHIPSNDAFTQEMIVSSVPFGALVGAMLSSHSSDKLGRRRSIILSSILFTIGTAVIVGAINVDMVVLGRLILGLSVGLSAMIVPMYLSELSPARIRGSLIFVFQLAITIGILFSYLVNYYFSSTGAWRHMFAIGFIPSILLGVGMAVLPKSPRWLILKNRHDEAHHTLKRIRKTEDIHHEFHEIKNSCQTTDHARFKDLFSKDILPLVLISFSLFAFQQLSGINTIFYYAPRLFSEAGITNDQNAILAAVICGATNVIATIIGVYLVERMGRRKLLFLGFSGLVISLLLLGLGYHGLFGDDFGLYAVGLILAIIVFFAISLGGIPYILMAEIFPLRIRHLSMATASCANWGFNILVSATFLSAIESMGIGNTYLMYCILTACGFILAYFYMPETKNQTLEHIEKNLVGSFSAS